MSIVCQLAVFVWMAPMQREGLWVGRLGPPCRAMTMVCARRDASNTVAVACHRGVFVTRDGAATWKRVSPWRGDGAVVAAAASADASSLAHLGPSSWAGRVTDMLFWKGRLVVATGRGLFVQHLKGSLLERAFAAVGNHRVLRLAGGGPRQIYAAVGRRIWVSRTAGRWASLAWLATSRIVALAVGPGRRPWVAAGAGHTLCLFRGRDWRCQAFAGRVLDLAWFGPDRRRLAVLTSLGLLLVDPVRMHVRFRYRAVWSQRIVARWDGLWVFAPGLWRLGPLGRWQQVESGLAGRVLSVTSSHAGSAWAVDGTDLYSLSQVSVRSKSARSVGWCRESVNGARGRLPQGHTTSWVPDLTLGALLRKQPRVHGVQWQVVVSLQWVPHLQMAQSIGEARWRARRWSRRRRMRSVRLVTACRRLERLWVLGDLSRSQRVWVRSQARRIGVLIREGS